MITLDACRHRTLDRVSFGSPLADSFTPGVAYLPRCAPGTLYLRSADAQKRSEMRTRILIVVQANLAFSRFDEDFFALGNREGRPLQFLKR